MISPSRSPKARGVALVTGGTSGIGLAVASQLVREGWAVIASARHRVDLPCGVEFIPCDVRSQQSVTELIDHIVDEYGRLDLLVTCAATAEFLKASSDLSTDVYSEVMATNYLGAVRCSRAALEVMMNQRGGRIVILASGWALMAAAGTAPYAASKAAIAAFGEALSYEASPFGVDVRVVYPGYVPDTGMSSDALAHGMRPPPLVWRGNSESVARRIIRNRRPHQGGHEIFVNPIERLSRGVRMALPSVYQWVGQHYDPFPQTKDRDLEYVG